MDVQVKRKTTRNISESKVLQQTVFWSRVKRKQGVESEAFEIRIDASEVNPSVRHRKDIIDDVLILIVNIGDNNNIAYVPYGPTIRPSDEKQGAFLEKLSEGLRCALSGRCVGVRYDLLWESPWAKDNSYYNEKQNWLGPPAKESQEIRMNFDTQNWNLKKALTNILPADTNFIDLKKDEGRLLKEMKAKTRYNIRLSRRKGVRVKSGSLEDMDIWNALYRETCARNGMCLPNRGYFRAVLDASAGERESGADVELLIAEIEGRPVAAMFLVISGKRATYLYGASSSTQRKYMPAYALQWHAIKLAKSRGCTEYDMFGLAPHPNPAHPLYGLYRFKTGFGGTLFHRLGCWDYPFDQRKYEMYRAAEMTNDVCALT
jgi:lipid II:glycine glycyltransferase (peptidoglycan interpeptide bridge formation enzyme)